MTMLWRIALEVPEAMAAVFAEAIGDHAEAVATFEIEEGGRWLVEATSVQVPDSAHLVARVAVLAEACGIPEPALDIAPLPAHDWVRLCYQGFPPLRAGRFDIRGSHITEPPPPGCWSLRIDAATAFGTGEHATTRGCLLALDQQARRGRPRRMLDMGCGSGILALAAARAWHVPVLAVDVDPEAVRVAGTNAQINGLARWVTSRGGDGYREALVRRGRPWPLITANILARPLARMAPALSAHLAPGGRAILSGLLLRHERLVLAAHRTQGLVLERRTVIGDWCTLLLRKPAQRNAVFS